MTRRLMSIVLLGLLVLVIGYLVQLHVPHMRSVAFIAAFVASIVIGVWAERRRTKGKWVAERSAVEVRIDLTNVTRMRRRIWIEPSCSEHFLAPGQPFVLIVGDDVEPTFEIEQGPTETILYLNQHKSVAVLDHGQRRHIMDCWCETPEPP